MHAIFRMAANTRNSFASLAKSAFWNVRFLTTDAAATGADASPAATISDAPKLLVDFYADWCGPCRLLAPVLERVAAETNVPLLKINVDEQQELASKYKVQSIPTVMLFKAGKEAGRFVGAKDFPNTLQFVNKMLKPAY